MNYIIDNTKTFNLDPIEQYYNIMSSEIVYIMKNILISNIYLIIALTIIQLLLTIELVEVSINYIHVINKTLRSFMKKIIIDILGTKTNTSYYNIWYIFVVILILNILGLGPYHWTATSWFELVFYFAFSYFFWINLQGLINKKWEIFGDFLPGNSPIIMSPFLVPIEILSQIAKVISLSVRLFANMFSGHALLKILVSFSWEAFTGLNVMGFGNHLGVGIAAWLSVSGVAILETIVAMLQAYVFTLLIIIFLSQSIQEH